MIAEALADDRVMFLLIGLLSLAVACVGMLLGEWRDRRVTRR